MIKSISSYHVSCNESGEFHWVSYFHRTDVNKFLWLMIPKDVKNTEMTFYSWLLLFISKSRLQNKGLMPKMCFQDRWSQSISLLSMEDNLPHFFHPHKLNESHEQMCTFNSIQSSRNLLGIYYFPGTAVKRRSHISSPKSS